MKHLKLLLMAILAVLPFSEIDAQSSKRSSQAVVEVLSFHNHKRCRTCIALEDVTKEVVNTRFATEVKAGRVRLREIDLSTKEGEKLGDKYEVTWSSLIIVRRQGGKEKVANLTDVGFRYALSDKKKLRTLISQKISEFLK